MFIVLNSAVSDNEKSYGVVDLPVGDGKDEIVQAVSEYLTGGSYDNIEIVTEDELKLLVSMYLPMKDPLGDDILLDGTNLKMNVPEIDIVENEGQPEYEYEDTEGDWFADEDAEDDADPTALMGVENEESGEADDFLTDDFDPTDLAEEENEEEEEEEEDYFAEEYEDPTALMEEEEEETEVQSIVSRLYDLVRSKMGDAPFRLLQRYYMWYSQRLLADEDRTIDYDLNPKNAEKKRKILESLRNSRGGIEEDVNSEWRFAGWIDMGRGETYRCEVGEGHRVRNVFVVWSVNAEDKGNEDFFFGERFDLDFDEIMQSRSCLTFGRTCLCHFFGLSAKGDVYNSLGKAQEESLKDLKLLSIPIYMGSDFTPRSDIEVADIRDSFKIMSAVIDNLNNNKQELRRRLLLKDYVPPVHIGLIEFFKQFEQYGLVPPKSIVQLIRSCIMGWTDGRKYFSNSWSGWLRLPESRFYLYNLPTVLGLGGANNEANALCRLLMLRGRSADVATPSERKKGISKPIKGIGKRDNADIETIKDVVSCYAYLTIAYEMCGYYKYTAEKNTQVDGYSNTDEGGYSEGIHDTLYSLYKQCKVLGAKEYTLGGITQGIQLLTLLYNVSTASHELNEDEQTYFQRGIFYKQESRHSYIDYTNRTVVSIDYFLNSLTVSIDGEEYNLKSSKWWGSGARLYRLMEDYGNKEFETLLNMFKRFLRVPGLRSVLISNGLKEGYTLTDLVVFVKEKKARFLKLLEDFRSYCEMRTKNDERHYKIVGSVGNWQVQATNGYGNPVPISTSDTYATIEEAISFAERNAFTLENDNLDDLIALEKAQEKSKDANITNTTGSPAQEANVIDTTEKLIKFLVNETNGKDLPASFKLHLDILDTVSTYAYREPSPKQMVFLNDLYHHLTGENYKDMQVTDKVKLEVNPDMKKAIEAVLSDKSMLETCTRKLKESKNKDSTPERFADILGSVLRYGTASERQMVYVDVAQSVYLASLN